MAKGAEAVRLMSTIFIPLLVLTIKRVQEGLGAELAKNKNKTEHKVSNNSS